MKNVLISDCKDYDLLLNILNKIDNFFPVPLSSKQSLENLCDKLIMQGTVFLAYSEGKVAGVIAGYMNDTLTARAYISILGVFPEHQRKSVAEKLVNRFVEKSINCNMNNVFLYTHKTNTPAQRLYEKLGFKKEIDINRPEDFLYILCL